MTTTSLKLNLPKDIWTAKDTLRLAQNTLAMIKFRTSKGQSASDKQRYFKPYSTRPIYIQKRGAGITPKGGRLSRTGNSVYYAGGYREYKHKSRRRTTGAKAFVRQQSAEVDLVLSGNLMNNLVVTTANKYRFKIGLTAHVAYYGYDVNAVRPFLGLTSADIDVIHDTVRFDLEAKLKRGSKR